MDYSIGTFSVLIDLSIDTLRYYEKEGLIIPKRNETNQRIYNDSDVVWMEFIKRLKLTGMPIKKIKQYAALRYQGDKTVQQRLELLYEQQIQLVKQKEEVEEHIRFLNEKIEVYKNMLK